MTDPATVTISLCDLGHLVELALLTEDRTVEEQAALDRVAIAARFGELR